MLRFILFLTVYPNIANVPCRMKGFNVFDVLLNHISGTYRDLERKIQSSVQEALYRNRQSRVLHPPYPPPLSRYPNLALTLDHDCDRRSSASQSPTLGSSGAASAMKRAQWAAEDLAASQPYL